MVNYQREALDRTFSALADPTRRAMLSRLMLGEARVGELARPFRISLPAVSRHIRVLEEAGLVRRRRDGREHYCSLVPEDLRRAADWLEQYRKFFEDQLESFAAYIELDQTRQTQEMKRWQEQGRTQSSESAASSRRRATGSSKRGPRRSK